MTSRDPQRWCEGVRAAILATAWLLVVVGYDAPLRSRQNQNAAVYSDAASRERERAGVCGLAQNKLLSQSQLHMNEPSRYNGDTVQSTVQNPATRLGRPVGPGPPVGEIKR